jgi:DNA-binding response OmpR family regulator
MKKKILIVDDDDAIRRMVEKILSFAGYDVVTACSGDEALEKLRGEPYNLVLLDVMMPGRDGFDVSREMKGSADIPQTPVIFVTAKGDAASLKEGFSSGGMLYLTKPFTANRLLAVVRAVIGS